MNVLQPCCYSTLISHLQDLFSCLFLHRKTNGDEIGFCNAYWFCCEAVWYCCIGFFFSLKVRNSFFFQYFFLLLFFIFQCLFLSGLYYRKLSAVVYCAHFKNHDNELKSKMSNPSILGFIRIVMGLYINALYGYIFAFYYWYSVC